QWSTGAYAYDGAGNIKQIGGNAYQYDNFNRLTAWSGPSGSGTRAYDNFGNTTSPAISGTTNHIAAYTYDAAGNVLTDGIATYTYDALNATTGTNIGARQFRYLYTPQDERIAAVERVNVSGTFRNRVNWTLRSMDNRVLRIFQDDYTSGTRAFTVKEETFWRGGSLLASRTSAGTRHYGLDHLGSPRILTDTTGSLAGYQDFAPFGTGGTTNGGALQFTSHERDTANLAGGTADLPDYMHARYYRAGVGRFLSVDPIMSAARQNPQSWNRYAYALNSPLMFTDPTGMYVFGACTGRDSQCLADRDAFERSRREQLESSDESVRNAAAAYGNLGEKNGVTVAFAAGDELGTFNGDTKAALVNGERVSAKYDVRIRSGLTGSDLGVATVHEGEHVRNAQTYVGALQHGIYDPNLNLRLYQTEMNAYMVSGAYARTNNITLHYNGLTLKGGMPREQLRRSIDRFLRQAPYELTPETLRCQVSACE
ncbi:MAG: hypothetical protein QOH21_3179, partial [Acidobacteriota bacterium]|nr:hypothetical protein [Acidobacteriota bacterium]